MEHSQQYEIVVGLEVHAQLLTGSKLFCADATAYGAAPNTQVSPITLAHPGTLPRLNVKAVEYAVKLGLACNCAISRRNYFARKNYFYPDLPKGYQLSQHTTPVCIGGYLDIETKEGAKRIRLNRIHLEEDAGKSIHDADPDNSCVDYNRAGTPLVEIVTEPDIRSADEAYAFLTEIRKLVRYLDVCDGNMEEGSLRCDANVSVRKKGEDRLGTKVEIKNLNSIRNVKKAIEFESERLISLLEQGGKVEQQTRSFDADQGITFSTREKEDADDYRYFADPDLPPFVLQEHFIEEIRTGIPALQPQRVQDYTTRLGLSAYDAQLLTEERSMAEYFEEIIVHTPHYKAAANWMLGPVRSWLNEQSTDITRFPVSPSGIAELIGLIESEKISFTMASSRLLSLMIKAPDREVLSLAVEHNLLQQSDSSAIEPVVEKVLEKFPDKVEAYRKGKKGLLSLFVGEVMKEMKGKADPKKTNELLLKKLNNK